MNAIIGGGIGGLTTALAFDKLGIPYHLFEREVLLSEVGAGIWLAPNALQVMDWLGLLSEIQKNGNQVATMTLASRKMEPFSGAKPDAIIERYGFSTVAIHRAVLQKILFEKIPDSNKSLNKPFVRYEPLENGKLKIHFEDGSTFEADQVIGADGINSSVRKQVFPNSEIRYTGQTCWRGIAQMSLGKELQHSAFEMWGDEVRFGFSAVSKESVYWFAVAKRAANGKDDSAALKSKLSNMFADFHPITQKLFDNTPRDKILRNDINDLKPTKKWFHENVCLIGDAGHAATPNMGQGGAQAIEDAYYLANIISKEANAKSAFQKFQDTRFKKVNEIVNRSWMVGKIAHWKYFQGLRNFIFKSTPDSVMEKQLMRLYDIEKF